MVFFKKKCFDSEGWNMFNTKNQMCVICESDQMATLSLHLKTVAVCAINQPFKIWSAELHRWEIAWMVSFYIFRSLLFCVFLSGASGSLSSSGKILYISLLMMWLTVSLTLQFCIFSIIGWVILVKKPCEITWRMKGVVNLWPRCL